MAKLFHPHSILGLILSGFAFALLPLALALGMAAVYVDRLAKQSQSTVVQVVEVIQGGRLLISQITDMERSARQYLVLREDELLEVYRESHKSFQETLEGLMVLTLEPAQRDLLTRLSQEEASLFQVFGFPRHKKTGAEGRIAEFVQLTDLAKSFLAQGSEWVDKEIERLRGLAGNASHNLRWLVLTVIPFVLLLAGVFAALIIRPLRHIMQAIRRLGREDFTTPIIVQGPRDLEELGERLDWLRNRLAELNKQKVHFLRHMSHELKTPLTTLREGAELLNDQVLGPLTIEQHEVVTLLGENSLRLERLINDLLNFNQALSRNLTLSFVPIDLVELIETVIENQRLAWKARDLNITTELAPLRLTGDRIKLTTIVDNLLSNAIKFSPLGGRIHFDLKSLDHRASLEVRDSGPGFHPADGERIFEAFYQGRAFAKGHVKGSGLGLAIAREYARAHQGRLEIVNDDNTGGCIRLYLPLDREK